MKTLAIVRKSIVLISIILLTFLTSNPLTAQNNSAQETLSVKGIINSDIGPLSSVSIYLKNSKTGTVSKSDGTFSFPSKLKLGDVLIFSYLGYEKQEVIIKPSSSYLDIFLKEAPIDVLSAINTNRPFKSKRSKSN